MFLLSLINLKKLFFVTVIKKKYKFYEKLFFILFIFTIASLLRTSDSVYYFILSRMQIYKLDSNLTCFFLITLFYLFLITINLRFFFIPSLLVVFLTGSRAGFIYLLFILIFFKYFKIRNKLFFILFILILFSQFFLYKLISLKYDLSLENFKILDFSNKYLIDSSNYQGSYNTSFFFNLLYWGPFRIINIFDISSFWKIISFGNNIDQILKDFTILFFPHKYLGNEIITNLISHNILLNLIYELSLPVTFLFFYFLYSLCAYSYFIKVIITSLILSSLFLGAQTTLLLIIIMLILLYSHCYKKIM
jgi:hypothetical protein